MSVCAIETEDAFNEALGHSFNQLVVIDFYAVWCGPCTTMAAPVRKLASEYTDVSFYKLDIDNVRTVAAEQKINSMPTFILYKDGGMVNTVVGAKPKALEDAIKSHI